MVAIATVNGLGRRPGAALVAELRHLAKRVELVLLCGQDGAVGLVRSLRAVLPRHNVTAILTVLDTGTFRDSDTDLIESLLGDGAIPVAVIPTGTSRLAIAAAKDALAHRLDADHVLTVGLDVHTTAPCMALLTCPMP